MDSKLCWRIDNFLGPAHTKVMHFWDYDEAAVSSDIKAKSQISTNVAKVHQLFRNMLGFVDQSDVKATVMGLTSEKAVKWYGNQLTFLIESAISSCHGNYNLDPHVHKREGFTEWYSQFLNELIEMSPNYRKYANKNSTPARKPKREERNSGSKRSHKKGKISHRRRSLYGTPTIEGIKCYGRDNMAKYLRMPDEKLTCRFCGKKRKVFRCIACQQVFCMEAPTHLTIPGSEPQRKFRKDGLFCWHLLHGFETWKMISKKE